MSKPALTLKAPAISERVPPSASPASGVRGAIDSLVQGSLVELFAAYGVSVAPLPRVAPQRMPSIPEVSASVAFGCQGRVGHSGLLTLSLPGAVLAVMNDGDVTLNSDRTRELANQLMGRLKNRLLQFSVRLDVGVSSGVDAKSLMQQLHLPSSNTRVYAGRTLRGEILVTLEGLPDESQLLYVGRVKVAAEGDAILF